MRIQGREVARQPSCCRKVKRRALLANLSSGLRFRIELVDGSWAGGEVTLAYDER